MAYQIISELVGLPAIASTDAGVTHPNGTSAVPSPPAVPGMIVKAIDPTYGMGEFILLRGCANTVVGSVVRYNDVDFDTTLIASTAVQVAPVAVAMAANTSTSEWAWYQISGTAVMAKVASGAVAVVNPNSPVYISATAGKVMGQASAGKQIVAARSQTASTASATTTVLVTINRPHCQSAVT